VIKLRAVFCVGWGGGKQRLDGKTSLHTHTAVARLPSVS